MRAHRFGRGKLGFRLARGADEGANLLDILLARRALDAGGYIDARRAGHGQRLRDVAGIEAARQHERDAHVEALEQRPVERLAQPAGPGRLLWRARVENQAVGDRRVEPDRRQIAAIGDRQRLHYRQTETLAYRHHTFRRFVAVQLQHVGGKRGDDAGKRLVIGIDGKRDLAGAALGPLAQRARGVEPEMARARREEHEADQIGAGFHRDINRFRGLKPADFDQQRHGGVLAALPPSPQSAKRPAAA